MTWVGPETADTVEVPDVVGLEVPIARKVAWAAGVVLVAADPDGPPLGALTWPGVWVVTAQSLPPGSVMRRRGSLVVEFRPGNRGDSSGDREPRPPKPNPGTISAERERDDEPGERAVEEHEA